MLRQFVNYKQDDWDELLPLCTLAYNSSRHSSTSYSPNFLMFGQDLELVIHTFLQYGARKHKEFVQQISFSYAESRSKTLTFSDMRHGVKTKASDKMLVDFEVLFLATAGSFQAKRGQLRIMNWPIYHHHCFMIMAV